MRWMTLVCLWLSACTDAPQPEHFTLVVSASSDEGQPLADTAVRADGEIIGRTDGHGRLVTAVSGVRGRRVRVSVDTPPGYRPLVDGRLIALEPLRAVHAKPSGEGALELNARFAPRVRRAALLVDVGRAGLPVQVFGAERAVTNEAGVAMLLTTGAPGDHVEIRVNASGQKMLRPAFLTRTFTFDDRPQAFVLAGAFSETKKPVKRPVRPTRL